ncbi:MAG: amidohydrolase family protein [Candidatus Helarchaeota archaeon]
MRIDFHCHVFRVLNSREAIQKQFDGFQGYGFYERMLLTIKNVKSIKTNDVIEKTLFHVKKAGIDKVVLLPLSIKENDVVKNWYKAAPEVFIPFFNPPEKINGDQSPETIIEKALKEDEYRGLKIMLPFRKKHLNDKILYPALEMAQQHDVPVVMHAGYPPPGTKKQVLTYSNPIKIVDFIDSFPKLNLVIAHMGFPWVDVAISLAVQYQSVYLDVSNLTYMMPRRLKDFLMRTREIIGLDKILFGSDTFVPEMIEVTARYFNDVSFLSREEVKKILGLNAKRLLHL